MFMNKKGFAISVVLYTMVLLVVGIFYLLLGIVRNRYTVGNDLKNAVIDGIAPGRPYITDLATLIEKTLPLTEPDIDGARFVYGSDVADNYLWYSGKLWRIVSLNGDGSIKLVTQGNMSFFEYTLSSTDFGYSTSQVRKWLNNEFLPTLYNVDNLLKDTKWDYTAYESFPTKKLETNKSITEKVGLLNIYEYMKTGGTNDSSTTATFLNNGYYWWTMSLYSYGCWLVDYDGVPHQRITPNDGSSGIRPSITLKSSVEITGGIGTKLNPYVIAGDKNVGITSEALNNRISGEYVNFNDVLYRIVGIEEIREKRLTKVTMADYSVKKNVLSSVKFGANIDEITFSPTYGIGLYLENWYKASSTSTTYKKTYIKNNYKAMIATKNEGVRWYTGPTSGTRYDYTLAKTGSPVSATIGLGYYGEMFSSQFGDGISSSGAVWLITRHSTSRLWDIMAHGDAFAFPPIEQTLGVRPSFYLRSDVKITGGNGQPNNPYTLTQ